MELAENTLELVCEPDIEVVGTSATESSGETVPQASCRGEEQADDSKQIILSVSKRRPPFTLDKNGMGTTFLDAYLETHEKITKADDATETAAPKEKPKKLGKKNPK